MLELASEIRKYFRNRTFGRSTAWFRSEIECWFAVLEQPWQKAAGAASYRFKRACNLPS